MNKKLLSLYMNLKGLVLQSSDSNISKVLEIEGKILSGINPNSDEWQGKIPMLIDNYTRELSIILADNEPIFMELIGKEEYIRRKDFIARKHQVKDNYTYSKALAELYADCTGLKEIII